MTDKHLTHISLYCFSSSDCQALNLFTFYCIVFLPVTAKHLTNILLYRFFSGDCQALNLHFTLLFFILFLSVLCNVVLKQFVTEKSFILFKLCLHHVLAGCPFFVFYEAIHTSYFSYADYFNLRIFDISWSVRHLKRVLFRKVHERVVPVIPQDTPEALLTSVRRIFVFAYSAWITKPETC